MTDKRKEYISMERATAIVGVIKLRPITQLHINDLHALCNAAAEQARADLMKELLGESVEPVAFCQWVEGNPKLRGYWILATEDTKKQCLPQG